MKRLVPFILFAPLVLFFKGITALAGSPPPNIVLIIGDDISSQDLGCFGNPGIRTPNLDRLAANALVFDNAYVTASSCSPSRCSILTGRYPHNLGTAAELHRPLPEGLALFPKLLRDIGYHTAQAGKNHFGKSGPTVQGPARLAFDVSKIFIRDELHAGAGGQNQWLDLLRERPMDRPFFLWLASFDAHRIWDAGAFTGMNRPEDVTVPPYLADTPETREDLARYYDEITRLDYYVGKVVEELQRQEVLEDTLILFLSDNGRPFPHSKNSVYDDGMKTPLILHWPQGIPTPGRTQSLASAIDIAPTLLEIAGIPKPDTVQGVSLLPILKNPKAKVRDYLFAERNWHNFQAHVRMVRFKNFVYVRNAWPELPLPGASDTFYNPSADALKRLHVRGELTPAQAKIFRQPRPAEELYNVETDPFQINNLLAADPEPKIQGVHQHLSLVLDRWQEETGDSVPTDPTPTNVIYDTGQKIPDHEYREPPGASTGALRINRPGPIHRISP